MPTLQVAIAARKAQEGAKQIEQSLKGVQGAARLTRDEMGRFQKKMDDTAQVAFGFRQAVSGLFGTIAAIAAGRDAINTIAQYEQVLQTLRGVVEATDAEMEKFNETARELGATTRFSATEAASGLLTLARAGLSVEQSTTAIAAVLNLAQGELMQVDTAAGIVVATLAQFRLGVDQATRVTDVLITSSAAADTSAEELGQALKFAGAFANAMSVDLETASAALAVLSNNALKGMLGGTALRGVIAALAKPTNEAEAALEGMDLKLSDVNIQANGLVPVLRKLRDAGFNANDALSVFGREITPGALALVNQVDDIERIIKLNENAAGSAQKLADTVNDSLLGAFARFRHAIEEAYLELGDAGLTGGLRSVVDVAADVVFALIGAEQYIKGNADSAMHLASILKSLGGGVAMFIALESAIKVARLAMLGFNAIAAANPVGLVVVSVAALVAGLLYLKDVMVEVGDYSFTFGDLWSVVWDDISNGLRIMVEFMAAAWDKFIDASSSGIKMWANLVLSVMDTVGQTIGFVIDQIVGSFEALSKFDISRPFESMGDVMLSLGEAINPVTLFDRVKGAWQGAAARDYLGEAAAFAGEVADEIENTIASALSDVLSRAALRKQHREGYDSWARRHDVSGVPEYSVASTIPGAETAVVDHVVQLSDAMDKLNAELLDEVNALAKASGGQQALNDARERARATVEATNAAEKQYGANVDAGTEAIKAYMEQYEQMMQLRRRTEGTLAQGEMLDDLAKEIDVLGRSRVEREYAARITQYHAAAMKTFGEDTDEATKATELYVQELKRLDEAKRLQDLADDAGQAFGDMFTGIVFGAESAGDAIEGLARQLAQLAWQTFVADQISGLASSFLGGLLRPSARGNAFSNNRIIPFRKGGITDGPELFPLAGGDVGIRGEAGDEAVLPLTRDGQGRAAVHASGSGGRPIVYMTVITRDLQSFNASQHQIARRMGSAIYNTRRD